MFSAQKTAAPASDKLFVEDVFSTWLYTGGSDQTITNYIDLVGKGGLVWIKIRNSTDGHALFDTDRGVNKKLESNTAGASATVANSLTNFYSSGFRVGGGDGAVNSFGGFYDSWTFRKSPKFFDVVTFTGTGASQLVSHNLGVMPGFILYKATNTTSDWFALARNSDGTYAGLRLNQTAQATFIGGAGGLGITSTTFNPNFSWGNTNGTNYVAYLFAHDATSNGIIQCGSYTGNGSSSGPVVTLGWEPQWVLIKNTTTGATDWFQFDNMRGMSVSSNDVYLRPNLSSTEGAGQFLDPTSTGFQIRSTSADFNTSGNNYIYMAIRRGPMRTPTLGTSVFSNLISSAGTGTQITTGFPIDYTLQGYRPANLSWYGFTRLTNGTNSGQNGVTASTYLNTNNTDAEGSTSAGDYRVYNTGFLRGGYTAGNPLVYYNFGSAPGFFDVVAYTGTGVYDTPITHNLGVPPELIIVKSRSLSGTDWPVRCSALTFPQFQITFLNRTDAAGFTGSYFVGTPTATTFNVDGSGGIPVLNQSGQTYIAYLFASTPGVSKVGSYTGNGSSQTINCGFTTGARFFLVKRTSDVGNWWVFDAARGITAPEDPAKSLNNVVAEINGTDSVDPDNTGIIVNQNATTNLNASGSVYIFLAIA